jgi:hypothetical protein
VNVWVAGQTAASGPLLSYVVPRIVPGSLQRCNAEPAPVVSVSAAGSSLCFAGVDLGDDPGLFRVFVGTGSFERPAAVAGSSNFTLPASAPASLGGQTGFWMPCAVDVSASNSTWVRCNLGPGIGVNLSVVLAVNESFSPPSDTRVSFPLPAPQSGTIRERLADIPGPTSFTGLSSQGSAIAFHVAGLPDPNAAFQGFVRVISRAAASGSVDRECAPVSLFAPQNPSPQ